MSFVCRTGDDGSCLYFSCKGSRSLSIFAEVAEVFSSCEGGKRGWTIESRGAEKGCRCGGRTGGGGAPGNRVLGGGRLDKNSGCLGIHSRARGGGGGGGGGKSLSGGGPERFARSFGGPCIGIESPPTRGGGISFVSAAGGAWRSLRGLDPDVWCRGCS
jgi:hypothetical protein